MDQKSKSAINCGEEIPGDEMKTISGGGLIDIIVRYAEQGITYCYNMGLNEALRYKKQVK